MASNAENVSIWWRHHDGDKYDDARACCLSVESMLMLFSSAGAYPMLSRPSSIIYFSNQIACLTFYAIFLIFGFNGHNNISPKRVELENFDSSLLILMG